MLVAIDWLFNCQALGVRIQLLHAPPVPPHSSLILLMVRCFLDYPIVEELPFIIHSNRKFGGMIKSGYRYFMC